MPLSISIGRLPTTSPLIHVSEVKRKKGTSKILTYQDPHMNAFWLASCNQNPPKSIPTLGGPGFSEGPDQKDFPSPPESRPGSSSTPLRSFLGFWGNLAPEGKRCDSYRVYENGFLWSFNGFQRFHSSEKRFSMGSLWVLWHEKEFYLILWAVCGVYALCVSHDFVCFVVLISETDGQHTHCDGLLMCGLITGMDNSLKSHTPYGCESKPKVPFWGWLPPHYSLF